MSSRTKRILSVSVVIGPHCTCIQPAQARRARLRSAAALIAPMCDAVCRAVHAQPLRHRRRIRAASCRYAAASRAAAASAAATNACAGRGTHEPCRACQNRPNRIAFISVTSVSSVSDCLRSRENNFRVARWRGGHALMASLNALACSRPSLSSVVGQRLLQTHARVAPADGQSAPSSCSCCPRR
jgi:hypothetical protein